MADRLRFHPLVAADLSEALQWYDEISIGLGNRFRESVDARFDEIAKHPEQFALAYDDVRFTRLRSFPYIILFRERGIVVHLLGVFHGASDPEKWRERSTAP